MSLRLELSCKTPAFSFRFAVKESKFCKNASHRFRSQKAGYEILRMSMYFGPGRPTSG